MRCFKLYSNGDHRWFAFGQDQGRLEAVADTNQVVVTAGRSAMLMDPGGVEVFPAVIGALVHEMDMETVNHLFLSHQDPDVGSSLALWRQVTPPGTQVHVSGMWAAYIAHYDAESKLAPIADEGGELSLGGRVTLRFLPAHYLHSSAAFCVYDPVARILFSGDIGAAFPPEGRMRDIWVTDFADHIQYMAPFHRRVMGSPAARDAWVEMISRLPIDIMVPQHGLAFQGQDVQRFLNWFSELPLGSGLEAYRSRAARG